MWLRTARAAAGLARRGGRGAEGTTRAGGEGGRYRSPAPAPAMARELLFGVKTWGGGLWARAKHVARPVHQEGTMGEGRWGRMYWGRRRARVG